MSDAAAPGQACESCGFVYDTTFAAQAGAEIVLGAGQLAAILGSGAATLGRRPAPDTWSVLEYGCHVRDVLLVQRERVLLARRVDCPAPEPMGREERVEHDGYGQQDPAAVARQLGDAAALFAGVLDRLDEGSWRRTMIYTFPARVERDLAWVAMHTLHEVRHHLADVRSQVAGG